MSTRSFIGKKIGNKVKYFFCHWDGYVDEKTGVGFTLNKYYNDEKTVDELFDSVGGHIESLEKTPEETVADLQKVAKEYPRFGKEIEGEEQKIANFYTYLRMCGAEDTEWTYLYDDGEWFYTIYNMRGFHSLKDSLNDWGHYVVYRDKDKQYFCTGDEEAAWDYFLNFEKLNKECLQLVDARTGKQIAADYMWKEKYGDEELEEHYSRRGRIVEDVNWSKNDTKVAMKEVKADLENALGIKLKRGSADSFSTTYKNKDNEVDIEVFRETDDEGEEYSAFVDVNFFVGNQDVFNFFEKIPDDPRERKSLVREVVKQIKKPHYPEYDFRGVH